MPSTAPYGAPRRPPAGDGWYRLTIGLGRVALALLDVTTRVHGLENIPRSGPVILAATHISYPDFLPIGSAARDRGRFVRFLARGDVWDRTWPGYPMSRMRHVPVDRAAPAAAYLMARRLLRAGEAVGTFPEAGISHSFAVRPLMRGTAALAREVGVPVVPVAQWGLQRIFTVGRPVAGQEQPPDWTRGRLLDIRFGEPMTIGPREDLTEWTRGLGGVLTQMLEGLQTLPEHRPAPGQYAPWYPAHLGGHAPDRREAMRLDDVPRAAVPPTWGPPLEPQEPTLPGAR